MIRCHLLFWKQKQGEDACTGVEIHFKVEYPTLIKKFHGGFINHRKLEQMFYVLLGSVQQ